MSMQNYGKKMVRSGNTIILNALTVSSAYYTNAMSCVINAEYKCSLQKIIVIKNLIMASTKQSTQSWKQLYTKPTQ